MRLIDADELLKEANADGAYGYVSAEKIANATTIEAEPVKHGRWIRHLGNVECSECLNRYSYIGEANYCPNCGARMDGGTDNE